MTEDAKNISRPLHKIFAAVPPRYDLVNHLFTWGMDKKWRLAAARECTKTRPAHVLDLCCGTGDLSIDIAKNADYPAELTGLDFSEPMLEIARRKVAAVDKRITFINGDAANLPFPDAYFDCAGISFAFRNLTYQHPNAARHLSEILRVLKPGGKFVAVESSQPKNRIIRFFDHLYINTFVYPLGWLVSSNKNAYNYLRKSSTNYYSAVELQDLLLKAGFTRVTFKRLFLGAVAIHIAIK